MNFRPLITSRCVGPLAVLLAWELASRTSLLDPVYFPPPSTVLAVFSNATFVWALALNASKTIGRSLVGFVVSSTLAVCVGIALAKIEWCRRFLEPIVELLRPLPSAAVIPVCILLLGIGDVMKVAVIMFGVFWPVVVSTYQGIRNVDPVLRDAATLCGLSPLQIVTKVDLPYALPSVSAGLRISLAISLILGVTAEMIAGSEGLGFLLLDYERGFLFREMYACILVLAIIGYYLNSLYKWCESRLLFYEREDIHDRQLS
jgi:ABC-type nitrate/sulfonate/bicarbonate transport system permease component